MRAGATTAHKPHVESVVDHDGEDDLESEACWDAGEHLAVSVAVLNMGSGRPNVVTVLCVTCNVKLLTWKEYGDDFTFE